MIPRTSHPEFRASIVAAEMTEFIPGAGPPPHKIPSFTPPSFQQRGNPDKRTGSRPRRVWNYGRHDSKIGGKEDQVTAPAANVSHAFGSPSL
jgi:hypothetical protein